METAQTTAIADNLLAIPNNQAWRKLYQARSILCLAQGIVEEQSDDISCDVAGALEAAIALLSETQNLLEPMIKRSL